MNFSFLSLIRGQLLAIILHFESSSCARAQHGVGVWCFVERGFTITFGTAVPLREMQKNAKRSGLLEGIGYSPFCFLLKPSGCFASHANSNRLCLTEREMNGELRHLIGFSVKIF
ncbi:hypothetical protein CEXT_622411 [Caerostris extrusa]|uniref:Secreted protein n=1 Tax=Caerostris extrusa TaxID=172846 RepID=A0AAV4SCW8_CAEEX|nr:hypothetical protein CEXT_622411 [Caerostris extrusa]